MARRRSTLDVLCDLVPPAGRTMVDVGCGDGALVRALAARGARAIGIEVSAGQLERARAEAPVAVEHELRFDVPVRLDGIDALRARVVGADPTRAERFAAREDELRAGLERLGHEMTVPSVAHVLRRRVV